MGGESRFVVVTAPQQTVPMGTALSTQHANTGIGYLDTRNNKYIPEHSNNVAPSPTVQRQSSRF